MNAEWYKGWDDLELEEGLPKLRLTVGSTSGNITFSADLLALLFSKTQGDEATLTKKKAIAFKTNRKCLLKRISSIASIDESVKEGLKEMSGKDASSVTMDNIEDFALSNCLKCLLIPNPTSGKGSIISKQKTISAIGIWNLLGGGSGYKVIYEVSPDGNIVMNSKDVRKITRKNDSNISDIEDEQSK